MLAKWRLMMIIELILSTASLVSELVSKVSGASKDKKKQISDDLARMAEVLEKVAIDLEADRYPHDSCAMMYAISESFMEKMAPYLEPEIASSLHKDLQEAAAVERLYAEKTNVTTEKIKIAAGRFLAASLLVKY